MKCLILTVCLLINAVVWSSDLPTCESQGHSYPFCNSDSQVVYEDFPNPLTDVNADDLPQNGWWWNPDLSGEGVFIEIQPSTIYASGYTLFGSLYSYDDNGDALWLTFAGPYEPNENAERWKQVADFRVLHPDDVAPVGTLMGSFSSSLSEVAGGTCVDCGTYKAPQPAVNAGDIQISWTQPYKLKMVINGQRTVDLKPLDVNAEDGSFLTDGLWAVDSIYYGFSFFGSVPGTSDIDPYPYMKVNYDRSTVNFTAVDIKSMWDGKYIPGESTRTLLDHIGYKKGVKCYLSSGIDAFNAYELSPVNKPYSNHNFIFTFEGRTSRYLACHYPENDTLRIIFVFYDIFGTPYLVLNESRLQDMLGFLPKGNIQDFTAYVASATDYPLNRGVLTSGQLAQMVTSSEYSIESSGMHFSKITEGGVAVDQMPDYANSREMFWSEGSNYTDARKNKSNGPNKDDIYAEQEVVNGFYVPTQYDKQKQKPYSGWYWDPLNPGWGMSYTIYDRADGTQFFFGALFTYKADGKPVWYVLSGDYEEGATLSATAMEFKGGTCYTCSSYKPNSATGYEFDVDIAWGDKRVLTMSINNNDFDMQRFDLYDNNLEQPSADFLTEGKYQITGIRVEATYKAFHDGFRWYDSVVPITGDEYGRGRMILRPPSENPARPQYVFSRSTTGWDKMDMSKLKSSEQTRLRQTIGVSDDAVFYIQDSLYDEQFMNLMMPEEYENDHAYNPYGRIVYVDHSEDNINDKGWWNVTQDIGRMVLAYEPSSNKVKLAHLGGDDIKRYPNISNGVFELKDEFFLFEGVLGTAADHNLELYPVDCPPGICSNPAELESIVFDDEWYKRNFFTMNKFSAMGENLSRLRDYSDWCPYGSLRKAGFIDSSLDPYTFHEIASGVDGQNFVNRCPTYFPDEASDWYPEDWLFKTEYIETFNPFVEIYHEK